MWPFDATYPKRSIASLEHEYDFIVAGGGTAGCVLARRLSESGKYTVLLVEQGDAADGWLHRTPLTSMSFWSDGKHNTVFDSKPDPSFSDRSWSLLCGRGLGGTSRINAAQYTCGVPAEYNAWRDDGREGWGYDDLRPYFLKSESWTGPVPKDWHGANGPLDVRSFQDYFFGCNKMAMKAAEAMGFAPILDMHSPLEPSIGWNKMQYTIDSQGNRQSSFRAYLPKHFALERQKTLHICIGSIVSKIDVAAQSSGQLQAESIEIRSADGKGPIRNIKARREIVVTCGALKTPQVLMLSGLGPASHLRDMGIEVVKDLPGVGGYLQDHTLLTTAYYCPLKDSMWAMFRNPLTLLYQLYLYLWCGTGWLLSTMVEMEIFGMSSAVREDGKLKELAEEQKNPFDPNNMPDFAVMACSLADFRGSDVDKSRGFFGLNCGVMKTASYGQLTLQTSDPLDHPLCDMRYLSAPEDYVALRAALRVSVELARQMCETGFPLEGLSVPSGLDDASLDAFIKKKVKTMYHYSSTCRMASLTDAHPGVVDDYLRVHGVPNLRIADASIFPTVPSTHPQAVIYAVAEKCADLILSSSE